MKYHQEKYQRREFIKLAALGTIGIYLAACGSSEEKKKEEKITKKDSVINPVIANNEFSSSANVTYFKKGDEQYEILRHGHNKRFNKFPAVIALCKTTEGVQEAIAYAKKNNWPVAIKSGGHSLEGFSCNNDGMVINLSEFNKIDFLENEEVRLGPACTLSQLYEKLLPENKIIPGGSCGGVAIGGLALGGGYGMYSRKFGLTCDSLLEVKMIDGNGKVRSSADEEDLLWACKGGGAGNFGVITEMKFKTHPAPKTLTAHRFRKFKTDAQTATNMLEKWFLLSAQLPPACFSVFILNGKTVFILLTNFEEETSEVKNIIEEFSSMSDKTSLGTPEQLDKAVKTFFGVQKPVFAKNSSVGLYKSFEDIKDFITPTFEKISATPGMLLSIGTLGGKINDPEAESNSAFAHRAYPYLSELQTYWSKEEQGEKMINAYKEVRDIFQDNGIKREYINYPDLGFRDWQHAYYGDNYEKLRQIKKKYDPENIIRHEQSVN